MSKGLCDYNPDKTSRWPTEGMYFNIVNYVVHGKGEGKVHPRTGHEDEEEE